MIDFELTPQQAQVKEMVHQFAKHVVRPISLQADKDHRIPDEFMLRLANMRAMMSVGEVPAEYGGEGGGAGEAKDKKGKSQKNRFALIGGEEMAWGDISVLMSLPGPGPRRAAGAVHRHARAEGALLRRLQAAGTALGRVRADRAGRRQRRRRHPHQLSQGGQALGPQWPQVLHHQRRARRLGGHLRDRRSDARGAPGIAPSWSSAARPGFSCGKIEDKMGICASETAELVLEECRVPEENLLGGEAHYERGGKEGFMAAMKTFDSSRPMVGVARHRHRPRGVGLHARLREGKLCVGAADPALCAARRHARQGQARARCGAPHVLARGLDGRRRPAERQGGVDGQGLRGAGRRCRCARDAVQIMGAHGLEQHQFVEKWYRDIKVFDIFEGTGQIQRIVSRNGS